MRRLLTIALVAAIVLIAAPPFRSLAAADDATLREKIETLAADYRKTRPFSALTIGILRDGKPESFGYGEIGDAEAKQPADGRTLFEIGSCSKVFTSLSLASLVAKGDLRLDDPIGPLLPDAPLSADAAKITLRQLSTHTSGLPRLPIAMLFDALLSSDNPYANFTDARLIDVLKSWKASEKKPFLYSNLGVGLLGHVLQKKIEAPDYATLLQTTVTGPLRLEDTVVAMSGEQSERYAVGHDLSGKVLPSWDFQSLAGAGAIRSTADDLLKFLQNQIAPEDSPLKEAILLSHRVQHEEKKVTIGLGWLIDRRDGATWLWHNGATGGYVSYIAFEPEKRLGLVLLSNTGDAIGGKPQLERMAAQIQKWLSE